MRPCGRRYGATRVRNTERPSEQTEEELSRTGIESAHGGTTRRLLRCICGFMSLVMGRQFSSSDRVVRSQQSARSGAHVPAVGTFCKVPPEISRSSSCGGKGYQSEFRPRWFRASHGRVKHSQWSVQMGYAALLRSPHAASVRGIRVNGESGVTSIELTHQSSLPTVHFRDSRKEATVSCLDRVS